jgi:hypothetical protein
MTAIVLLIAMPVLYCCGFVCGAWWGTRDKSPDNWHDNYRL